MINQHSQKVNDWKIGRKRTLPNKPPDLTLINLNLMLVRYETDIDRQNYIPLGPLYLASFLESDGYNVELIDYQLYIDAKDFIAEKFVNSLGELAPVVGLSCMSNLLPFALICARLIKDRTPSTRVILGGVGPSPVAGQITDLFKFVDCVVQGEGEIALRNFVRGSNHKNPLPCVLPDLDDLRMPAYHLLSISEYDAAPSIVTSRGCPYRCTFCTEPHNFGSHIRFRSENSIIEELEYVKCLTGKTLFLFQDDILPQKRNRLFNLLDAFSTLSFPITWKCFSRVDIMDERIMAAMAERGCVQVRYGIESGSNRILKRIQKGFTVEKAFEVSLASLKYFPSVHVSFIWGYPFEDMNDFDETLDWVERFENAGLTVLLFELSPLPGSQLYKNHINDLTFEPSRYSSFILTGQETVSEQGFFPLPGSKETFKLIEDYPQLFSGFYCWKSDEFFLKRERIKHFYLTRRTEIKNEYDL